MPKWSGTTKRLCLTVNVGLAWLTGCASRHGSMQGIEQRILDELRSEGIAAPAADEEGAESSARTASADAQQTKLPEAGPVSLADLFVVAESCNPSLAAARSEVGIAAGRAWQASLYPNPRIEVSAEEVPFRSGFDEGITMGSVVQPIVLGDRLRAATDAAKAEQAAQLAEVDATLREVFGQIAQIHARLLAIRQADALYGELEELGQQTLSMAESRFEARAAPETEVIRPQIELYQIDLARERLARERASAVKQLSLLLGGAEIDAARLSGELDSHPPELNLQALDAIVQQSHPSIVVADREIDAAAARLSRVKAERVPDLDVRFGAGYQGVEEEGIFEVGAGVMLPVWDNRQGDILSARFDLMRVRQQRLAVEQELLRRLAEAHGEYEATRVQLETLRDRIVPAATRSYEQTQEAYRGGRAVFLELLDAQRTLTEALATLADLAGNAAAARARIMQIAGANLDPNSIVTPGAGDAVAQSPRSATPKQPRTGAEVNP